MMRLRAYFQLVRLPNVPTAMADVCLAALALAVQPAYGDLADGFPVLRFFLLLVCTCCLYAAGMVFNDVFDVEQDRRERPFRPLPSGQITRASAVLLGGGLMLAGVSLASIAGMTPLVIALVLVVAILLYDRFLKRFWAGPFGMGFCRFLNVLLGLSLAGSIPAAWGIHLALVVGLYVAGVTWLARTEAQVSQPFALGGAAVVMLVSLALALPLPVRTELRASSPFFPYLLVALGFLVGLPVWKALQAPTPDRVQAAVKRALLGLVILDAVLATALAGTIGLVLLLILVPVVLLRRMPWLYVT